MYITNLTLLENKRLEKGLTITELIAKAKISRNAFWKMRNRMGVNPVFIKRVADVLGVTLAQLTEVSSSAIGAIQPIRQSLLENVTELTEEQRGKYRDSALFVDLTDFFGLPMIVAALYSPTRFIHQLLDSLYSQCLAGEVNANSFGREWKLRDEATGELFSNWGSNFNGRGAGKDERTLEELGLTAGMALRALKIELPIRQVAVSGFWKGTYTMLNSVAGLEPTDVTIDIAGDISVVNVQFMSTMTFFSPYSRQDVSVHIRGEVIEGRYFSFYYDQEERLEVLRFGRGIMELSPYGNRLTGYFVSSNPVHNNAVAPSFIELIKLDSPSTGQ